MATVKRRRIHLTETPLPAVTVARLVEQADVATSQDSDLLVFHPHRSPITNDEVSALLDEGDADLIDRAFRD